MTPIESIELRLAFLKAELDLLAAEQSLRELVGQLDKQDKPVWPAVLN